MWSQPCLCNISLRIVQILLDEGIDHVVFLDFLQVGVLALILDVHLHPCIGVHLRWLLMVEQELGRILADLSSLIFLLSPSFHLREDDATGASTFLGYNIQQNIEQNKRNDGSILLTGDEVILKKLVNDLGLEEKSPLLVLKVSLLRHSLSRCLLDHLFNSISM